MLFKLAQCIQSTFLSIIFLVDSDNFSSTEPIKRKSGRHIRFNSFFFLVSRIRVVQLQRVYKSFGGGGGGGSFPSRSHPHHHQRQSSVGLTCKNFKPRFGKMKEERERRGGGGGGVPLMGCLFFFLYYRKDIEGATPFSLR